MLKATSSLQKEAEMPAEPKSLAEIAAPTGFLIADIAFLADIEESTLSRLWDDPNWLDRVKGKTLRSIVSVVPRVGEYIAGFSLADRRSKIAESLSKTEAQLDESAFRRLVRDRKIPEQYLSNALDAAITVLSGDSRRAASCLARFWGRDQDFALAFLFGNHETDCLLADPEPLITASIDMIDQLNRQKRSFHALVAQANLMHHVARARPEFDQTISTKDLNRQSALAFRSTVIGRIISSEDFDLAERYGHDVAASPLLSLVEGWAFPTYTHDAKASSDFSLPRSLCLQRTAEEVLLEVEGYNEAYLYYLSGTSIPTLLQRDPTFGLRLGPLKTALETRMGRCEHAKARRACEVILKALDGSSNQVRGSFDDVW